MAFKDYKNLDLKPEEISQKELKELRKKYHLKTKSTPILKTKLNLKK